MADKPKSPTPEQPLGEQGIFEPKPLNVDRLPVSGTVRAIRLGVFLLMISAGVLIWLALRNPFMRPVKRYYKALNKRDTAAMTEAFPEWLAGADTDEGTVTVEDMCAAIVSATKYYFGQDSKATVVLRKQQEVGEEYLTRIADGIFTQYQRKVEITRGCWLTFDVTYKTADSEQTRTEYARVYRINGSWYLLDIPSDTA